MYEILLVDSVTNWYKRIATFGTKANAVSFLKKVGISLIEDYTEIHPMVSLKVREITAKIY